MARLTKEQALADMPPRGALPPLPGLGLAETYEAADHPYYVTGVIGNDGLVSWHVYSRFTDTLLREFDHWREAAHWVRDQY
jgi:hypothetical protein